ncbi:MAG: prephenate dehydrogenase/arogenate dehydrogenase family protein [Chloroflexi bacterium]|nr:prephenate dehydrogenase/arogenate dehydrogenase family protein [Chloroflexota bacterium]
MARSRIAIIGLGLIGGSIGLALKKAKIDADLVGHDKNSGAAGKAVKRGAVDKTEWNLHNACDGAGLVILALPLDGVKDSLDALKLSLAPGVIVTDTATSKVPVMEWATGLPQGVQFIGGDPVISPRRANAEHGIEGADADLFQGATYALSAATAASSAAIDTMSNFVALLGAKPYFIDPAEHDGLTAGIQHLPALLATALQAATIQSQGWHELAKLAGADFRAATEVAPQEPKAAREQFLAHRDDLTRWIDTIQSQLQELRGMIARGDAAAIEELVATVSRGRDKWLSGNLEETGTVVDYSAAQSSLGRLFLGGLAERGRKPR